MSRDNLETTTYAQLMDEHTPYLTIDLELDGPVDLVDFVDFFASVSSQFDRHMKATFPDIAGESKFFVKEVRKGSIIAELFPGGVSDVIAMMDNAQIVIGFADLVGQVVLGYVAGKRVGAASKNDLKNYLDTVKAVANDRDGKATLSTSTYEEGLWSKRVAFSFDSNDARKAKEAIEDHRSELEKKADADKKRVTMYFSRTDKGDAQLGKRSGERVIIPEISDKDLPLVYSSNLAEERIKDEIRHSVIFQRGFLVDVNVEILGDRPVAYKITHVHQAFDLPDDGDA